MKKILAIMLVLVIASSMVFAQSAAETAPAQEEGKRIDVLLWSTCTGTMAECLQQTVDEFNEMQDKYFVTAEYQGSYMDIYTKLTTTLNQEDLPDAAVLSTELCGTYRLTDGLLRPLSYYWKDTDEPWAKLNGSLKSIWGDAEGHASCYPFGNSFYGNFVNAEIFEAAGLDPYVALTSVKGLYEACKTIREKGIIPTGPVAGLDSWGGFVWYGLAAAGIPFFDNGNGHTGIPTEVLIDTPEVHNALKEYFYYFRLMQQEELIVPYGSAWGDEVLPRFGSQQIAIATGSIAAFGRIEKAMAEKPFAMAWVPCWSAIDLGKAPAGYAASGTGFGIIESGNEAAMAGAAEFIAYTGSTVPQTRLDLAVGYLPISSDILNSTEYQNFVNNRFPAAAKAFELQKNGVVDFLHTNALNPINNECQAASAAAWSQVMSDLTCDIDAVIDNMSKTIKEALAMWRTTNL